LGKRLQSSDISARELLMNIHSRRDFLKMSAAGAALGFAGPAAFASSLVGDSGTPGSGRIVPFPLGAVRLGPGIFAQQAETNARYLDSLTTDRLLHSFRLTAGITSSATPYKGWEDPTCELRGHFNGGHYLSAVALASATAGNSILKSRGDEVVSGLAQCQTKNGNGYVSAFPTGLFEHLVQGKEVWAPFYTYHKIMAGLLDMYVLTGNTDALKVAEGMARWVDHYFEGISDEQRQRMLRTEYGGMNEALVNLAALTKKQQYIDTAKLFEQPSILDPLAARRDELQGLHANTNVPKMIGAARMYEVTGDARYRRIAEYFLEEVLTARSYAIGNTSLDEHWTTPADQLKGSLGWTNAECCVAYNLMKLERLVFGWTGDARWMDAYERSMFNCRLGTQNAQGLKQYFFPLAAGYWRAYHSAEDSFWCCTGTGVEEFAKFTDTIYFHRGGDVYVNQFIASTLDWKDEGLKIEQTTQFPREQGTTLNITSAQPKMRTVHVRIPEWTTAAAEVKVNGRPLEAVADPGSYLAIRRMWKDGDTISLSLPMALRTEALAGDESVVAAMYGPLVLAADLGAGPTNGPSKIIPDGSTVPKGLAKPDALLKAAGTDWVSMESAGEMRFKAAGAGAQFDLMPMWEIRDQKYGVYWQAGSGKKQG
jgi:uncharacterized protein